MAHVAFIAKNRLNPAYGGALHGARTVAARFGLEVRHSAPEKPDDIAQQAVLIEQAIDAKPAAILLIAAHETKLTAAIRAINRARIPLVSLVGEPREGEWICHVGSDDVALSRAVAERALARLAPGAEVAILDGHPDSITTPKRHRGFFEALAVIEKEVPDAPGRLESYAEIYATVVQDGRFCLCGMLAAEYETLSTGMRAAVLRFFDDNQAWLAQVLEAGRASGTIDFSGESVEAARTLVSGLEGAMLVARPYGDPQRFRATAAQLLAGVKADGQT